MCSVLKPSSQSMFPPVFLNPLCSPFMPRFFGSAYFLDYLWCYVRFFLLLISIPLYVYITIDYPFTCWWIVGYLQFGAILIKLLQTFVSSYVNICLQYILKSGIFCLDVRYIFGLWRTASYPKWLYHFYITNSSVYFHCRVSVHITTIPPPFVCWFGGLTTKFQNLL